MFFAGSAKVGKGSGCDDICESVERCSLSGVVKGHLASVHVQNHSYHFWLLSHVQWLPWCCAGLMLSVAKPYRPESLCWCQHVLALPVDGLAGYSQHPVGVVLHLHIPAMASRGIALSSQHLCTDVKAFWVVWQLENLGTVLHNCEILWEDEAASCCVGIQNHGILREKMRQKLLMWKENRTDNKTWLVIVWGTHYI